VKNKQRTFSVEIRHTCKTCEKPLNKAKRQRTFCSTPCRQKDTNKRHYQRTKAWQKAERDRKASIWSPDKLKCKICKRYYVQVGTHVYYEHGLTAREYREQYNLPVKRGVVPRWYREQKGNQALENKTYKNLESGKRYRYKKGDKRAKVRVLFFKGKNPKPTEYYT
jgi:predicted transcriptional regulator